MITAHSYFAAKRANKKGNDDPPLVDEDADQGKDRYQRLYWETVGSGEVFHFPPYVFQLLKCYLGTNRRCGSRESKRNGREIPSSSI